VPSAGRPSGKPSSQPWGLRLSEWRNDQLFPAFHVRRKLKNWEVVQTIDIITPGNAAHSAQKSLRAKLIAQRRLCFRPKCRRTTTVLAARQPQHDLVYAAHVVDAPRASAAILTTGPRQRPQRPQRKEEKGEKAPQRGFLLTKNSPANNFQVSPATNISYSMLGRSRRAPSPKPQSPRRASKLRGASSAAKTPQSRIAS